MNCHDVREMADSFLSEELLTETNHEIVRHLETCAACRDELDSRRRLRGALRDAFARAPGLQPSAGFHDRLRAQIRSAQPSGRTRFSPRWLALAAGLLLVAGITGGVLMRRSAIRSDALARDAVGDHQNCALKYRLARAPVPLADAALQFDSAYRVLQTAPPDQIPMADGTARVTERHSCAYGDHRFGHVIMEYQGRVVSLLMTAHDTRTGASRAEAIPHVIGRPVDGLSVVSVNGASHAVLLVSDLSTGELTQLSNAVSLPLVRRLDAALAPAERVIATSTFVP